MAQQAPTRSIRELRQKFGVLSDQAVELAASLRACGCGEGAHADDGEDLDAMVEELLAVRQRVGGCICGPPCDGTSVDDVSKDFLDAMLARLQWQAAVLEEGFEACECPERQEVESPGPVHVPLSLMSLPPEIRGMIWWRTLADNPGLVRITPRPYYQGRPISNASFHPQQRFSVAGLSSQRWTYERFGEESKQDGWVLLYVNKELYEEAEAEFWRRAINDNVMLSFGPPQGVSNDRLYGIIAAYTFFRDCPVEFLQRIRRVHLDLRGRDDFLSGAGLQALAIRDDFGVTNWGDYTDRLLDLMRTDLTGLRHLSLTIGGWVPDMRQTPWIENYPGMSAFRPPQDSTHWVTRLRRIVGLTRLRLRVVFTMRPATSDDDIERATYFLSEMRSSMLVNGDVLGDTRIHVEQFGRANIRHNIELATLIMVECDDSWDEETGTHRQHREEHPDYDPDRAYFPTRGFGVF